MKKNLILVGVVGLIAITSCAQESKEIRKEVNIEVVNGVKHLTIKTIEDGKVTEEVYSGQEAELKIQELEASVKAENAKVEEHQEVRKEVKIEVDENGEKTLTIITEQNGTVDEEVYKGAEADKKIKELEETDGGAKIVIEKEVIKE